jgi:hypothetical protein
VEGRGSGLAGGCNLYAKGPVHKLLHLFKAFSVIMICEYYNYFDIFFENGSSCSLLKLKL